MAEAGPRVDDPNDTSRDHYIEANNNKLSPHNLGWYSDFNPEQRYALIVRSYIVLIDAIQKGDYETAIDDYALWIVANAPADQEAIAAGAAYFKDNPQYMEGYHDRIFGSGYTNLPTYETENIPRIPLDSGATGLFDLAILQKLTDDPSLMPSTLDWQQDLGMAGNFLKNRIQDDESMDRNLSIPGMGGRLGQGLSGLSPNKEIGGKDAPTEYPSFGPDAGDLWASSGKARHGPDYDRGWQQAQNAAADVPGFVVDMFLAGTILKTGMSGVKLAAPAIAKAMPSGLRSWIANALVAVKGRGSSRLYGAARGRVPRRRTLAAGNAGIAVATTLANWGYQAFDGRDGTGESPRGLTPETESFLSEMYQGNAPKGPVAGMLDSWMRYSQDQLDYMKAYDNESSGTN